MMSDFDRFILWEHASRDTIDFKKIYVDIAGDLNAGIVLSEMMFWYLPSKKTGTENKLRVERDGYQWIACRRYEWWDRTRMSPKEADRAMNILVNRGLIVRERFKFCGEVTVHIRLIEDTFLQMWEDAITTPILNPFLPKVKMEFTEKSKSISTKREIPYTETTTKTTKKILTPSSVDEKLFIGYPLPRNMHYPEKSFIGADGNPLPFYVKPKKPTMTKDQGRMFDMHQRMFWEDLAFYTTICHLSTDEQKRAYEAHEAAQRKAAIQADVVKTTRSTTANTNKSNLETEILKAWGWDIKPTPATTKRVRRVVNVLDKAGCLPEHIPLLHKHCIDTLTQFTVNAYETQWDVWRTNNGKVLKPLFTQQQIEPTNPTANANDFVVVDDDGSWIGRGMEADKELQRRRAARAKGEVA